MSTSTVGIWSNSQIVNATSNLTYKQTGVDTPSVKYTNASIYPLEIANTNYGVPIDVLPPMCAVISSNPINFTLTLDVSVGSNIPAEALTQSVSVTYIDAKVPYQIIPLSNLNVGSVTNISGNVNLAASDITLDTQVSNVKLATNSLVPWGLNQQLAISDLASGDFVASSINLPPESTGLYDGYYIGFQSTEGNTYDEVVVFLNYTGSDGGNATMYGPGTFTPKGTANGIQWVQETIEPTTANGIYVQFYNNSGSTITSDTIIFDVFVVRATETVNNAVGNPVNAVAPPNDVQDASGSITTGGTAQTVLASNANRRFLTIINPGNANGDTLWVNFGSDASDGAGSVPLGPGIGIFFPQGQFVPSSSVSLYASTTGDTFTVKYA